MQVDKPLTVQDIMNMNRDQYEGTQVLGLPGNAGKRRAGLTSRHTNAPTAALPRLPRPLRPPHLSRLSLLFPLQFDLTTGPGGGPYGDPMRWPPMSTWDDEVRRGCVGVCV